MKVIIRNKAGIPKKHLRLFGWKIRIINEKFNQLLYSELFLKSEGKSPRLYKASLRLGIPGNDIILSKKSENLNELFSDLFERVQHQLSKIKSKNRSW